MINHLKKYDFSQYAISLLYLNFFLLSPFFHHHHIEEGIAKEEKTTFHSHLLNRSLEDHHSENMNHHSLDDTNHDHVIRVNFTIGISFSRTLQLNHIYDFFSIHFYFSDSSGEKITRFVNTDPLIQLQWEKCVHSASNVSPPFVIAA